jgi:outer membrane protein assembly factor BamB
MIGAVLLLLLLGLVLSGCGATPVAQNWPGLTVDGDTVYAITGAPQEVHILDAETGAVKATFMPQGIEGSAAAVSYWSPVTVGDGLAFVGFFQDRSEANNGLYAIDPETGQQQWRVLVDSQILSKPAYADGVVYFGTTDKMVYAVDVESEGILTGWPFETDSAVWASPLVVDGRVYVASMDHVLYCVDAETGEEIWKTEVGGAIAKQPLLVGDILYVGAFDGRIYAIEADSGQVVEGFDFQAGNWIWSTPLLVGDQLFVTALDGFLYALDPTTGDVQAPYPYNSGDIDGGKDVIRANPVQVGEKIVIATEKGYVIAVEEAQQVCSWPSGVPEFAVYTTPVVSGEKVYIIQQLSGQVYAFDADALETGVCAANLLYAPPEGD